MFEYFSRRLFEEHQEEQGGGGDGAAPPVFDPNKFRDEVKREIVGEVDKRFNGLDKKFKQEFQGVRQLFDGLKTDLVTMRKPQEQQHQDDGQQREDDKQHQDDDKQQRQQQRQDEGQQRQSPPPRKPQDDPRFLAMERELKELKAQRKQDEENNRLRAEAAERKEIDAILRTEISKRKFNTEDGPSDLFDLLRGKLTRSQDNGNLYGPDGLTVEQFVEKEYARRPNMHPSRQVNGSGAPASSAHGAPGKPVDIDSIGPNSSKEDIAAYTAAIRAALAPGSSPV